MKHVLKGFCLLFLFTFLFNGFVFADGDMKAMFQKMNEKLVKAMLAGDNETILAMYTEDAYSLPSYSPMLKGKKTIAKQAEEQEKAGMKLETFTLTTVDVFGTKDQMIEVGTYSLTVTLPGQSSPVPDKGKYLTVWQKQADGSWKMKADIWNTDINPLEMMKEPMPKTE